jgi:hypothetical protein
MVSEPSAASGLSATCEPTEPRQVSGKARQAESFFSRLRRAEIGIHHHVAGPYLAAYASEMAWRENNRRVSNGEQYLMTTNAALTHPVSRQWKGYWQRNNR